MRRMLLDLSPGQDYALQFRSIGETASSEWSKVYKFRTDGDTIAPAVPTGLVWRATGSSFLGTWNSVTVDGNGGELKDFKDYEVTVTANSVSKVFNVVQPSFELTLAGNAEAFGTIAFTVQISVKSRDITGNKSAAVTATATEDTPPKPSAPVVSNYLGNLKVEWDGNPATGVRNDLNLNHVQIHASVTNNFTPSTSTEVGRFDGTFPGKQGEIISGLTYGTLYYVKLVAINRFGRAGTPSDQATGTPSRITNLDITNGTISTAQINFTAKDIGGANAYYPATNVARDALTGVKNGDIAYVTGTGYTPYRYNGTTWVAAPEVGVISGTKILTGTLTSDAVGTNLLITATANIANGIIDNAKISQLDAGKITTGTLQSSSTVTYGSSAPRPTWSLALNGDAFLNNVNVRGQIVVGNSGDTGAMNTAAQVRSFDYLANTAGWAIKGDGSVEFNNGTFRGTITGATINSTDITSGNIIGALYKTVASGRRVEIGTAGAVSTINFFTPSGSITPRIIGFTSTPDSGSVEALSAGIPISGAHSSWNHFVASSGDILYSTSKQVVNIFGGAAATGSWSVDFTPDKAALTGRKNRIALTSVSSYFYHEAGGETQLMIRESDGSLNSKLWVANNGTFLYHDRGDQFGLGERQGDDSVVSRIQVNNTDFNFGWQGTAGRVNLTFNYFGNISAQLKLVNNTSYGMTMFYIDDNGAGSNHRVEIRDAAASVYTNLWAAAFVVNSSETGKSNIQEYSGGALETMKAAKIKTWRRNAVKPAEPPAESRGGMSHHKSPETKRTAAPAREEIGLIAEEAPDEMRLAGGENGPMIDLAAWNAMNTAALQELAAVVESLEAKLDELKKNLDKGRDKE